MAVDEQESHRGERGEAHSEEETPRDSPRRLKRAIDRVRYGRRRGGEEPDPRYAFANERTFLAWVRTGLALVIAGLAAIQLLPPFSIPGGRRMIGMPLIILGAAITFGSYLRWERADRALRNMEPLPRTVMPRVMVVGVAVISLIAGLLASLTELR